MLCVVLPMALSPTLSRLQERLGERAYRCFVVKGVNQMKKPTQLFSYCLSFIALSFNLNAYAGTMGVEGAPGNAWTIGGSALYIQPQPADRFLFSSATVFKGNSIYSSIYETVNPSYSWGFDALLRYNFVESARDIKLSYLGFWAHNTEQSLNNNTLGNLTTNFNAADLLAGQELMVNEALNIHGTVGVAYARINQIKSSSNSAAYFNLDTTFNGAGPKVGLDAEYIINQSRASLVGGMSAALLVGSEKSKGVYALTQQAGGPLGFTNDFTTNSIDTTVTNVNANLGLRYYMDTKLPLTAEIGYRVYQYINYLSLAGGYLTLTTSFG